MAAQNYWEADEKGAEEYEEEMAEIEADSARFNRQLKARHTKAVAILRLKSKVPAGQRVEFDGMIFHKVD
jgi:hypothetical protein